jgi:hypothetical protein
VTVANVLDESRALLTGSADAVAQALSQRSKQYGPSKQFLALELPDVDANLQDAMVQSMHRYLVETRRLLVEDHARRVKELVLAFTPTPALSPKVVRLELAKAKMRNHVLESATWLTAGEIAGRIGSSSSNPNAQTTKWKRANKIFAIVVDGVDRFPAYALDEDQNYRPRPAMQAIILAFGPKWKGWDLAFWFAAANDYLDGKQPQEVILVDPDLVIEAAKDKAEGIQHG